MQKLIFLFIAVAAISCTKAQKVQNSEDVFSVQAGDYTVSLLSEGQREGSTGILIGATPEMIDETAPNGTFPMATNVFLIRTPDKNILIDTGVGYLLSDNLEFLGLSADEIDAILITHMHFDHIGGLLKDGEVVFPNAELYMAEPEYDYWANSTNQQALNVLDVYEDQLVLFTPNGLADISAPLFPGIFAIAAYGHTPGHTVYLIQSGDDKLLIWGDLTHAMAIQMPYPQVAVTYDVNPEEAILSREAVLKQVSGNRIPVGGMHIVYPGIGILQPTDETGYIFTPVTVK